MRLNRRHLHFAAAAALLGGLGGFPPSVAIAAEGLNEREFNLLRHVNLMRKARGLEPLALRDDLSRAARIFARRLADEAFFDHTAPDGEGPTDRADRVGYNWRRLGETLAAGQRTAAEAAESWRDSPGHAKIIFDPAHRHVGVGFWRRRNADPTQPRLERFWVLLAGDTL